jgi:N-terminal acetyltransferase B complex catalytic subunit
MYRTVGYEVYRTVLNYDHDPARAKGGEENAFDMRKALPRDTAQTRLVPLAHPITPEVRAW